jgi:hypothetical protein
MTARAPRTRLKEGPAHRANKPTRASTCPANRALKNSEHDRSAIVTPAKAGVQSVLCRDLDSRLRGNDKTAGLDAIFKARRSTLRIPPRCALSRPRLGDDVKAVRAGRSRAEAKASAERRSMVRQGRQASGIRLRIRVDRQEFVVAAWSIGSAELEPAALKGP